jgi:hypothetical protein
MRIYSYILTWDTGFAPNPQDGLLSLACCKPAIRRSAKKGDYIVAFFGKSNFDKKYAHSLAYIAKVDDVMSFQNYFLKFPTRMDCIYDDRLQQLPNSFHNSSHRKTDLSGQNVLLSKHFVYFGDLNMKIDNRFLSMVAGRGHKVVANDQFKKQFPIYFQELVDKLGMGKLGNHIHEMH